MSVEYLSDSFFNSSVTAPGSLGGLLSLDSDRDIAHLLEEAGMIRDLRFGRRINLYAPLYLSNYCSNRCVYCGFNSSRDISRTLLTNSEMLSEAGYLSDAGFKSLLIVGGEDERRAGAEYYSEAVRTLSEFFSSVSLEVSPFGIDEYRRLYAAGADGVTIYQETYDKKLYEKYHIAGRKKDFRYRLETPERAAIAGIPNINIGALLGLAPWREEVPRLAAHLSYLIKKYWKVTFGVSFPRIARQTEGFEPPYPVNDREFVKIIASMRKTFPDTPIYLSTRERPNMRDNLIKYGVTHMSAESRTAPGGYLSPGKSADQFGVSDTRSLKKIIDMISSAGLSPVFKDWDRGYMPPGRESCV